LKDPNWSSGSVKKNSRFDVLNFVFVKVAVFCVKQMQTVVKTLSNYLEKKMQKQFVRRMSQKTFYSV